MRVCVGIGYLPSGLFSMQLQPHITDEEMINE